MARRDFGSIDKVPVAGGHRWRARYETPEGRSVSKRFDLRREADSWLASQQADHDRGEWTDPRAGRVPFAEWQATWRTLTVNLRPSTRARDFANIDRYLLPTFGKLDLVDIDRLTCKAWVADLTARGLAPATVTKAKQILGKIMQEAADSGLIATNPVANVKTPTVQRTKKRFLTPAQIADLADVIDGRYRALVYTGCYCGLRIGEILALTWADVDPLHRTVNVDKIVTDVDGKLFTGPPKTDAGHRIVPIPRLVVDQLAAHGSGAPSVLVFPAPHGGHVQYHNWRQRVWSPAVRRAGLVGVRPHDMRHTAVSLWLASGADPNLIAEWAGHASVATILDVYGHTQPSAAAAVMDRLDLLCADSRTAAATVSRMHP